MSMAMRAAFVFGLVLFLSWAAFAQAQETPKQNSQSGSTSEEPLDFAKAQTLFRRRQQGEKLSAEEEAYLQRARAARNRQLEEAGKNGGQRPGAPAARDKTGMKPLTEMSAEDRYQGEDGGLYGKGQNVPPEAHRKAAEAQIALLEPLDAQGKRAEKGTIGFISISMSNATQEFSRFKEIADSDKEKSRLVTIVDCAQGGQAMAEWVRKDAPTWSEAERRLDRAHVSPKQVQVAWVKLANKGPTGDLQEHGRKLQRDTLAVIQNAKERFPNLKIVYLSSRIYGGYATNPLNPEPYAYESAFAARWLIQDQVAGKKELNYDSAKGDIKAPLLLWGPYLWADGVTPRVADKLTYSRGDLAGDGTHPSEQGRVKVAKVMLEFFKNDPLAKAWFVGK